MKATRATWLWRATVLAALVALVSVPALGSSSPSQAVSPGALSHLSQVVSLRTWLSDPAQAPATLQARFRNAQAYAALIKGAHARGAALPTSPPFGDRMNFDGFGLPQNEESVAACGGSTVEGTNDYRGILNNEVDFTGWHLSTDGGESLTKEGLLTSIDGLASSGDPAYRADASCNFYAADLNFTVFDPFTAGTSGVGVYRSDVGTLLSSNCDTSGEPFSSDPDCWPTRTLVATNAAGDFLDKEWISVGDTGDGEPVWVTWSDFNFTNPQFPFTASIMASRCEADLSSCSAPVKLSGSEKDVQFSDPTIGPDGRTYVSWVHVLGELSGNPQKFVLELRVAEPGSTTFGPTRQVAVISQPLPFGGLLNANNFRIASVPKTTVKLVNGAPRVFAVWDECRFRPFGTICEEARVRMAFSDDFGATWTTRTVSVNGQNYFPSIANDSSDGQVAVAYYTNRFDVGYQNAQDVELVTIDAATGNVVNRQRVTGQSNETEADWNFSSGFIGDYIDLAAAGGTAYVGYNSNIHNVKVFGVGGAPVPQQDNF